MAPGRHAGGDAGVGGSGHELWIYTNSFRGKTELLNWFAACGLPVVNIVNNRFTT